MGAPAAVLGHHVGMRQCYFSRRPLALKLQRRTTLFGFLVNATAAALCAIYMLVVFPPEVDVLITRELTAAAVALYTVICGVTAHRRARPLFRQMHEWLAAGRPPTPEERRVVLRAPAFFARMTFNRWALAGFIFTKLATQAVARPIRELRRATDAVREGDLEVSVPVDDGSEVGRLQAGFNGMVADLRERERLRDLYGRQVGTDVAREALARGWELGGETREVSALFVDVIGSTGLAQRETPERVVALLNEFFAAVVETVDRHCGLVNKFEGDAALCVFGAPVPQDDHAARALATARELRARIDAMEAFDAAIGVASGVAVAGYVGAETRFEYTVVGDPVNEAARLTELAKEHPLRLLASGETLRAAGEGESARWSFDGEAVLRGRGEPTRLAVLA
jgi:adenylate cyclase